MPSTIIITGGGGFVGRHLVAELRHTRPADQLIVWDTSISDLPAAVQGVAADITDPATYQESLQSAQPAWVIHLAAISSVGASVQDPARARRVNTEATRTLLATITTTTPQTKVLAVSSADIYGPANAGRAPLAELPLAAANPVNPYAESKLAMEQVIEAEFRERVVRVRPFPHIGPGQRQGFVAADFASQIAAIEAGQQPPVLKVGTLATKRDFTDVRDVVRAYRMLLDVKAALGEVYHVASGVAVSIQELLDQLLALSPQAITIQEDQTRLRPTDIPYLVGDASKLTAATSWQPTIPLTQTVQDILNDWRARYAAGSAVKD